MRYAKRPWGWWFTLISRKKFKVKLLRFKRGGAISHQRHKWRNELWLFMSGQGKMDYQALIYSMKAGDHKLVRPYSWHRFSAKVPTIVLEVQYGEQCMESDIERADV